VVDKPAQAEEHDENDLIAAPPAIWRRAERRTGKDLRASLGGYWESPPPAYITSTVGASEKCLMCQITRSSV
jgi:hypothetical protein